MRRLIAALGRRGAGSTYARAVAALERGDPVGAAAGFTRALAEAGTDAERLLALNKRGVAYVHAREREAALADFTAALEIDPRFAPAVTNIGNLLLEEGAVDDAIAHFEAALRYDDRYATAHLNLAVALRRAGRRGESVRHLRAAQRLESRQVWRRLLNLPRGPAE